MIRVTRNKRNIAPLAGGEANTASNVGSSGVGPYKQKTAIDLELYKALGSEGISIALDGIDKIDHTLNIHSVTTIASPTPTQDYIGFSDESAVGDPTKRALIQVMWNASLLTYLTTRGDVLYMGAASTPQRLAIGAAGQFARVNAGVTAPAWATVQFACHWQIPDPTADDDGLIAHEFPQAATIKNVIYQVSAGTNVVFNLEIRDSPFDGTPTAVWAADKTATTTEQSEDTFTEDAIAAHDFLALNIISVSGSVEDFVVAVEYELDA